MGIAVADTHAKVAQRIFVDGKKQDGSDIGVYGGGELYVNPLLAPKKFPPAGKNGNIKFENGKNHKTGYFEDYKSYRSTVGRPTDKVNLVLTGKLQSDFANGLIKKDELTWLGSVKDARNAEIVSGMNEKYGTIFSLSEEEGKNFRDVFNFELKEAIKNA